MYSVDVHCMCQGCDGLHLICASAYSICFIHLLSSDSLTHRPCSIQSCSWLVDSRLLLFASCCFATVLQALATLMSPFVHAVVAGGTASLHCAPFVMALPLQQHCKVLVCWRWVSVSNCSIVAAALLHLTSQCHQPSTAHVVVAGAICAEGVASSRCLGAPDPSHLPGEGADPSPCLRRAQWQTQAPQAHAICVVQRYVFTHSATVHRRT